MTHHRGGFLGMDQEDTTRALLWGTALLIVLITAFLIVGGYYWTVVKPRSRTVLAVGDQHVSYSAMKRRMAYEYYTQPSVQNQNSLRVIPVLAYQNLQDEMTLLAAKDQLGVSYTEEEFNAAMRAKVGVTDQASADEFGRRYQAELEKSHLHEDEFRRVVEASVLEGKVKAKILSEAGDVPQAKVEAIVVAKKEDADAAILRLKAGEDWATVAKAVSLEPDVATTGGLKDFQPSGGFPAAFDGYAFSAEPGAISEPLAETPDSDSSRYWVVRVVERSNQPLKTEQQSGYQNREYSKLLENTRANLTVVDKWSEDVNAQADALTPLIAALRKKLADQAKITPIVPTAIPPGASTPAADGTAPASTPPSGATSAAPAPSPAP